MCGCAVSRRYIIHVCDSDVFSVVNMYLDNLKFYVVCINGRRYACCSECYVVSNSVMSPPPNLCNMSVHTVLKLCTLDGFALLYRIVYKFLGRKQSFFASLINKCIKTKIYIIYTQIYLHI